MEFGLPAFSALPCQHSQGLRQAVDNPPHHHVVEFLDNASGAAALLELSRGFAQRTPARSVRCVGFVNEEAPFFLWGPDE